MVVVVGLGVVLVGADVVEVVGPGVVLVGAEVVDVVGPGVVVLVGADVVVVGGAVVVVGGDVVVVGGTVVDVLVVGGGDVVEVLVVGGTVVEVLVVGGDVVDVVVVVVWGPAVVDVVVVAEPSGASHQNSSSTSNMSSCRISDSNKHTDSFTLVRKSCNTVTLGSRMSIRSFRKYGGVWFRFGLFAGYAERSYGEQMAISSSCDVPVIGSTSVRWCRNISFGMSTGSDAVITTRKTSRPRKRVTSGVAIVSLTL